MLNVMNANELFAEETLIAATFIYGARGVAKGLDPGSTKSNLEKGQTVKVRKFELPGAIRP